MKFKLGEIWERTLTTQAARQYARTYVEEHLPALWEWLDETTFLGEWKIEAVSNGAFEYDTGYCAYDVIIWYSDESDAVHHRLRW